MLLYSTKSLQVFAWSMPTMPPPPPFQGRLAYCSQALTLSFATCNCSLVILLASPSHLHIYFKSWWNSKLNSWKLFLPDSLECKTRYFVKSKTFVLNVLSLVPSNSLYIAALVSKTKWPPEGKESCVVSSMAVRLKSMIMDFPRIVCNRCWIIHEKNVEVEFEIWVDWGCLRDCLT